MFDAGALIIAPFAELWAYLALTSWRTLGWDEGPIEEIVVHHLPKKAFPDKIDHGGALDRRCLTVDTRHGRYSLNKEEVVFYRLGIWTPTSRSMGKFAVKTL